MAATKSALAEQLEQVIHRDVPPRPRRSRNHELTQPTSVGGGFVVGSRTPPADLEDTLPKLDAPLRGMDDLLVLFHDAEKPRERWRVGTEAERIAVRKTDGSHLPYDGPVSVVAIFERLIREHGWEPERETPGGPIIALRRENGSITLEPGSQIELSGAPYRSVHEGKAESDAHWLELEPVIEELGLVWLALGCHPFASVDQLGWVPKMRYDVMREYMPTRGTMAGDMMTKTCTVQANLDYASEEDAMRKLRVGLRAQPIVTAMFANSPWNEGKRSGYRSYRALAWLHMDPDRSGLLPFAWKDHPTYLDYVEWALDAPMFLVKRGGKAHRNTGQTFRSFMKMGFGGVKANYGDWVVHLHTLFPEVRLKSTLEYRGADVQHPKMLFSLPALWKGLLYDARSFSALEGLVDRWSFADVERQRDGLARHGVQTKFMNREAVDWGGEILELAEAGLRRIGDYNEAGEDEAVLLRPLRALLEGGRCPADVLLAEVGADLPARDAVIRVAGL
jgi:glutamate--cysteine ligase